MIYFHFYQIKETVNFSVYQKQNSSSGKLEFHTNTKKGIARKFTSKQ